MRGYSLRHPVQRNFILRILNTDAVRAAAGQPTLSPGQARAQALKANGARNTHLDAMPDSLRQMLYPNLVTSASGTQPTSAGRITRIEVVDAAGSRLAEHRLVDVYRERGSSTYVVMNSEPAHKARVACFVAACIARGLPVEGHALLATFDRVTTAASAAAVHGGVDTR